MVAIVYASIVSIYIHIYTYTAILYINKHEPCIFIYTKIRDNDLHINELKHFRASVLTHITQTMLM